jgi:hypothetical protein
MQRGVWHQCGDRSQKLVEEQLQQGSGVGVVLSPRDLSRDNAIAYSESYRKAGAEVLIDHQFYVPDFTNPRFGSYPISNFRQSVSALNKISDQDLISFQNELRADHAVLNASAVIAPAVVYEAGRTTNSDLCDGRAWQIGHFLRPDDAINAFASDSLEQRRMVLWV